MKLVLEEIKYIHKIFLVINSSQDFIDYIKALIDNIKILFKKDENKMIIEFMVEYLFKQDFIQIDLKQKKSRFWIICSRFI